MNENVISIITEMLESGTDFVLIARNDIVQGQKYTKAMEAVKTMTENNLNVSVLTF